MELNFALPSFFGDIRWCLSFPRRKTSWIYFEVWERITPNLIFGRNRKRLVIIKCEMPNAKCEVISDFRFLISDDFSRFLHGNIKQRIGKIPSCICILSIIIHNISSCRHSFCFPLAVNIWETKMEDWEESWQETHEIPRRVSYQYS